MSEKKSAQKQAPPFPERLSPLIDAHTHLDACGAVDGADVRAILDRAAAVGVEAVVTIADDLEAAQWAAQATDWDPLVYAAVALHPTRAQYLDDPAKATLEQLALRARVVAVGETGMDMFWPGKLDDCADLAQQREAFAWHIDLAKRSDKPLMIHNRDADTEVLDVLRAEGAPETVIFHCFSSGPEMARTCIDAGWYLSLSGTVSFRNAAELRAAARLIPRDQLLVETDAPFLTPHPYRGAPNESYCLPYTVRALADLTDRPSEEIARETAANARRVYRLADLGVG